MKTTSVAVMTIYIWKVSFQKYLITAMFNVLSQQLKIPTLQLKILQTWINIGAELGLLTYYCMLLFLSHKRSFLNLT